MGLFFTATAHRVLPKGRKTHPYTVTKNMNTKINMFML